MNIKVWDDRYIIKSDSLCYKLVEVKTRQGKDDEDIDDAVKNEDGTYETPVGYVDNIARCFKIIIEREGRKNKCTTLDGYIKHIEAIEKKLDEEILAMRYYIHLKQLLVP